MSETVASTLPSGHTYLLPAELLGYFAQCGGEPERPLIEWARRFLRPDGVFVDIGAHIGTYTLNYAPEVKETHAFEPQRNTYHRLCGGIALSGNDTIHAHHVALSDNYGETELRVLTSDGGLSSICDLPSHQNPSRTETVMMSPLDLYSLENVCLLKIDVEGNELAVLKGAVETIKRSGFPPLLVEVWLEDWYAEKRAEITEFILSLGYAITPAPGYPYMFVCEHPARKEPTGPVVENLPEDGEKKKRILLTMIVKNENRVIKRSLDTMLPHVDGFVISDTGSIDGTPARIQEIAKEHGVRGSVYRDEWKNYGHNRTIAATRAREWLAERGWDLKDTYLFFCDADMKLHMEGFDKQLLTEDSYFVMQGNPGNIYPNTRLARADFHWKSHGVTHEFWGAEGAVVNAHTATGLWLEDGNDGGNRATKFQRDKALLEQGLRDEPENERYMFYLAQTYFDLGEYENAAKMYERRWQAGGYGEERMYSRMKQGRALLALGRAEGVDVLLRAYQEFPHRSDPLFWLAVHCREQGQNRIAEMLTTTCRSVPKPDPSGLFIEQDIYEWRLDYEEAISCYYTGNMVKARAAADRVARFRRSGIDYEHQARNQMHYIEPLTLLEKGAFEVSEKFRRGPREILDKQGKVTLYENSSPTLVRKPTGEFIVGVRLVNYDHANGTWFNSKDADSVIRTREVVVRDWIPDAKMRTSLNEVDQNIPKDWPQAPVLGLEDQRFVWFRDAVWFTANTWQLPGKCSPQMVLGRLSADLRSVEHLVPLEYDKMGPVEKNWLPFESDGELKLVYGYEPDLVVLGVDPDTGKCTEAERHPMPWYAGRFRGSAGPILVSERPIVGVEFGRRYLLVHEVTVDGDQRIYGQRLLEMTARCQPTRLSAPFYIDHRGVEFPLGFALLDGDRALITYGRQERESCYAIVAWEELLGRLSP